MSGRSLADDVTELARQTYADAEPRLHLDPQGRVYGTIVSGSFADMDEDERQESLYAAVERVLGREARSNLLFVFTNTPEEDAVFERRRTDAG